MKAYFVIYFLAISFCVNGQQSYFVDVLSGSDQNTGTSPAQAWQSIQKVNQVALMPGDSVLFRRGGNWLENLVPKGSGAEGKRIVIGAYGQGSAPVLNARGVISGGEAASYTIRLYNQEYYEFRDLKIKNFLPFEKPEKIKSRGHDAYVNSKKMGIYVEGKDCGTLHDIHFINLEICEVNGRMETKHNGGIFLEVTWNDDEAKRVKSNFDGVYTEGCYIHHVDRTGWSNTSVWWNRSLHSKWGEQLANGKAHNWYPSHNMIMRNNKFERAGANALIVRVAESPLVEHCLFTHNGWKGSGNASFPFNCDNALFQYNEACYTVFNTEADSWNHRKDADAGGFDSDWNCKNTVIQYNYSHHNGYGGILICCDGNSKTGFNDGTVVRYNIFEDNEHHVIRCSGSTTNCLVYNNVIFSGENVDSVMLLYHKSWGGYGDSTAYLNNIIYSAGKGNSINLEKSTRNIFKANSFSGAIKNLEEIHRAYSKDPLLKSEIAPASNWKPYLRFMLQNGSPAIDKGIDIEGHPMKDFLGNPVKGRPDIGAFEKG